MHRVLLSESAPERAEFCDAMVLRKFGVVPDDLSAL
jgi:hypothetical protein